MAREQTLGKLDESSGFRQVPDVDPHPVTCCMLNFAVTSNVANWSLKHL